MGLFDNIFGKDQKHTERRESLRMAEFGVKTDCPVTVFHPKAYSDVQDIINALKNRKNAVVHLGELSTETANRILDILSGAIFALDGGVYEMEKNIYMFSPAGVIVNG